MKRVAMVTVALALSMLVVGQALAQPRGPGQRQRPEEGQRQRPEGGRMQAGPVAGVMMALRAVELNDEERTAVRRVMGEYRELLQDLAQKSAPTEEQRGQIREAMQGVMQQVRAGELERDAVRAKIAEATDEILTDEQKAAAQELQAKLQEMVQAIERVLPSEKAEALKAALEQPRGWGAGMQRERPERPERERGEDRVRGTAREGRVRGEGRGRATDN